jgi:thymidylate synthase
MSEPRPAGEIKGSNFDGIYEDLLWYLTKYPDYTCNPREQKIKELLVCTLVLDNPRSRLLTSLSRNTNYGFGVGEFLWYWQGKFDLETMQYYNKRMKDFSDDGKTLNSAYGYRIKKRKMADTPWYNYNGLSQWEVARETLLKDGDSRRAVLHINQPYDQYKANVHGSKDVPCTLSLQFFIRNNELHLHTLMRSNDVIWGLTYDLFSFTLLQECMLLELQHYPQFNNLELGTYYHTAGSMHLYERHWGMATNILEEYKKRKLYFEMEPISLGQLQQLCLDEERLRSGCISKIDVLNYTEGVAWMAAQLNAQRTKRDAE